MPLSVGTRLGAYQITAAIGAGGMGEVYRARDTSLNRDVAIKILPSTVVGDPDRLARFRREAEMLAALSHANIAHVYGVEPSAGGPALVMEFVDGKTLDEVIAGGPMAWDDVQPIARQIADALECAHERGIIHRDLKPANVKITEAGIVKVLDFGLAKAVSPETAAPANMADSPTLTARATAMGVILGTAAYMAPEQAKGRPVDRRADIWAFGAVLFEMLAGRRAFDGDDVTEVLAAAIKSEPQWNALPAETPAAAIRLLRRCLAKDPKKRLRDISDGMLQLDEELSQPATGLATGAVPSTRSPWRRAMPMIAAAGTTALLVSAIWMINRRPAANEPVRMTVKAAGLTVTENPRPHIGMTPDGRIIYRSGGSEPETGAVLLIKRPDQFDAEPLVGTSVASTPFVSPDGEWVGFIQGRSPDNILFKVPIRGGPRTLVATAPVPRVYGVTWAPDDTIVFGTAQGLFKIPSGSDKPIPLTTSGGEHTGWHVWPSVVGSTGLVVFTIRRGDDVTLAAATVSTGVITPLRVPGTSPRYVSTGHIAYATTDGTLRAVPFDASRIAVTGPSIPMETGVYVSAVSGVAEFDVSASGTLAYISAEQPLRTLVWVDRRKIETALPVDAGPYTYPRLSTDDQRMSVAARAREVNVLGWEFARPGLRPLVRNTDAVGQVLWANDGTIFYVMSRDGKSAIYRQNADGTGQPTKVVESDRPLQPWAITRDKSGLVMRHGNDLALVDLNGEPRLKTLVTGTLNAALSPNGAWIAYESESREVIVRPFPRVSEGSWAVSSGPGSQPLWSRDGRELFYVAGGNMMSATVVEGRTFSTGTPKALFPIKDYAVGGLGRSFDVAKDGRFLMVKSPSRPEPVIKVVLNWFGEVSARVKAR